MRVKVPETKWELYIGAEVYAYGTVIFGNALYKPELDCYYIKGHSIPKNNVFKIEHKQYIETSKLEQLIKDIQR